MDARRRAVMLARFHKQLSDGAMASEKEEWDRLYALGCWEHLGELSEAAHYGAICGYYAAKAKPQSAILDVGCGHGVLLSYLRGYQVGRYLGVDVSSAAIEIAGKNAPEHASFLVGDFETLDLDDHYDVVVLNEVLFYFKSVRAALERVAERLTPNGVVIASLFRGEPADSWAALGEVFVACDEVVIRHPAGGEWRVGCYSRK